MTNGYRLAKLAYTLQVVKGKKKEYDDYVQAQADYYNLNKVWYDPWYGAYLKGDVYYQIKYANSEGLFADLNGFNGIDLSYVPEGTIRPTDNTLVIPTEESKKVVDYAVKLENYKMIEKVNSKEIKGGINDTILGPFKISYGGIGVSSIIKADGETLSGTVVCKKTKDKNGNVKYSEVEKIPNNENFYLKSKNGSNYRTFKGYDTVEVTFSQKEPEKYKCRIAFIANENGNRQQLCAIGCADPTQPSHSVTYTMTNPRGSITINKVDEDDESTKLNGAGYRIFRENAGWVQGGINSAKTYVGNSNQLGGTEYKNNSSTITIKELPRGAKYYIWETSAPAGYDLKKQKGYSKIGNDDAVLVATVDINSSNLNLNLTQKNIKLINISGYVWADNVPDVKVSSGEGNNKFDNGETKISGIKVYLRDKSNPNSSIAEATTYNGSYTFTNIRPKNLSSYYIEFDYSNTSYKDYIPVAYGAGSDQSKGLRYDAYPEADSELIGKATTYKDRPGSKENTYGLSHLYTTSLYTANTNTLNGINLGLRKLQDPEYRIEQDIAYAKINYGGQKYRYIYGGTGNKEFENTPLVNWEGKISYSRDIYPSDILGHIANNDKKLEVYVVYRIMIKNTAQYSIKNLYDEVSLNVTSLTESIDSIYELDKTVDEDFDRETKLDFAKWKDPANGKTEYKGETISLARGEEKSVYIQFKINSNKLKINNKEYNNPLEAILNGEKPEVKETAQIVANHTYQRTDYGWFDQSIVKEKQTHKTPNKDGWAKAHGMIFKLSDEERTISGRAFKDNDADKDDNEFKGNGFKDNEEKDVRKVKVDLLQKDALGKWILATRYPKDTPGGTTKSLESEIDEIYSFKGVTPGDDYILRFTYGDGNQSYKDAEGKEIFINAKEYKSTIVSLDSAKNAHKQQFENGTNNHGGEWYKYKDADNTPIDKDTYSVAVDNLDTRQKINHPTEGQEEPKEINADTPLSTITIENTIGNSSDVNTDGKIIGVNEKNEVVVINNTEQFKGFNLGIIDNPEPTADLEKVITNIKLTNAQENVIFNGNPEKEKMAGVSDLDSKNNKGSQFTRIEIPSETIYGSTLETTYEIRLTNTSFDNYVEDDNAYRGWYYVFGEIGPYSKKVNLNADAIDYLAPTVTYVSASEGLNIEKRSKAGTDKEASPSGFKYKELLTILDLNNIATKTTKSFNITTNRVLSSEDEDMEIINDIEITSITKAVEGKYDEESLKLIRKPKKPDPAEAITTITPPTGADMQVITIYIIAGVIALAVLATGVVIIKKKIL